MPLHSERKTRSIVHTKRLDHSVWSTCLDIETFTQLLHALGMERIDADPVLPGELAQDPACLEHHLVRGAVLQIEFPVMILTVITETGNLVQLLPERAAKGDIHLLEAAAYRQHGKAGGHGGGNQR